MAITTGKNSAGATTPARKGRLLSEVKDGMVRFFSRSGLRGGAAGLVTCILPATAYAQAVVVQPPDIAARFFVALIAGIVLAVSFQMLLTNLSAALGLSILSGATSEKGGSPGKGKESSSGGWGGTARKISSGFGLWALITASISLFFASWLAVRLSLTISNVTGAILALVIWAVFYIVALTVESSAVASLVGALAGVVRQSVRSTSGAISSMFGKSPEERAGATARDIAGAVREEFFGSQADFRNQLRSYLQQVKPRQPGAEEIGREIARVLSDTEMRFITTQEGKEIVVSFLEKNLGAEKAKNVSQGLQSAVSTVKQEAGQKESVASKVADTAMRLAGASDKEAQSYREKVENYLRSTKKEQLNPDAIKREIDELIRQPKAGMEALKSRVSRIDKSTITALLAQRKDISQEDARRMVDKVDQVLQSIRGGAEAKAGSAEAKAGGAANGVTAKIKEYLDSLNRPELSYEGIRSDLQELMHDPKAGADALIQRLQSIDRDDIKAILASRKDVSDRQAEQIVSQVENARDEVVRRAQQMKSEVEHRVEQAKAEALHQADEARKTAATAAWWIFASAVISAGAAVWGGLIGVIRV